MRVTIHQPEHLPWTGYFHKMAAADLYVFLDNVQFTRNNFHHRNRVLLNGKVEWLSVPIQHTHQTGRRCSIQDAVLDATSGWEKRYWDKLCAAYSRHPYFRDYADAVLRLLTTPWTRLVDLNCAIINYLAGSLGLQPRFAWASQLGVTGNASQLLLAICRKVGATVYLSGPMGRNYLDVELFKAHGIAVEFHHFQHPSYPQYRQTGFTPALSAIDLLFNAGPDTAPFLLSTHRHASQTGA